MIDLNDFFYFVQIVNSGGYTAASRQLNIPKSTLSYRIQQLEMQLDARLINRTSRQFCVTPIGQEVYQYATLMLQNAEMAKLVVRQRLSEPSGPLRFTSSVGTAQFAMREILPHFLSRFPKITVYQDAADSFTNIVAENFDLAIRAHSEPLIDSSLIQRKLANIRWGLFSGAAYLNRAGTVQVPAELENHATLQMAKVDTTPVWRLKRAGITESVAINPRFVSTDIVTLKQAACDGLGIVALPTYVCREELKRGELVPVLPAWSAGEATITALIPHRRGEMPSVRALIEFLRQELPGYVST